MLKLLVEIVELQSRRKSYLDTNRAAVCGTLYCANCPNFSTKSRDDLNNHIAKKHATPPLKITHKCKICFKELLCVATTQNKRTWTSDEIS